MSNKMKDNISSSIAVLKEQAMKNTEEHKEIKVILYNIENKLDKFEETKADKTDLKTLDNRTWGLVISFLMLLAGIIAVWFKR